jgi:hypothetical protein
MRTRTTIHPWKALVAVWQWARLVDNIRGPLGVIVAAIAIITGGLLLALQRLGYLNTVALVISAVCIVGGLLILSAALPSVLRGGRQDASAAIALRPEDRPISVRIDRDPIWHNVNYKAYVVEVHVTVTNQTDADIELGGFIWQVGGEGGAELGDIEVRREVDRYQRARPSFGRHLIIEPGATESGWGVVAVPFNAGAPELPTLRIKVSGYREMVEAWL